MFLTNKLFSVIILVYVRHFARYLVISRKVILVVCGMKIKNSWLNPFFIKVQYYPMQKYWIHQFDILLRSLCLVSLLPVAFYGWPQVFHTDPALLYPILPCIIPLIT